MALQENNLFDNRLPLLKLSALLPRFKANGVLRNKQEEASVVELLATPITLTAAAMVVVDSQSVKECLRVPWFFRVFFSKWFALIGLPLLHALVHSLPFSDFFF